MERERVQRVLRQRFGFRFGILFLSMLACGVYYFCSDSWKSELSGIVLGLFGSALVWAFVELFDIFVETNHRYVNERRDFIIMTEHYWDELADVFCCVDESQSVEWDKVAQVLEDMNAEMALAAFKYPLFSLSEEFEKAFSYLLRLYWKLYGFNTSPKAETTKEQWDSLYNDFVAVDGEYGMRPNELVKEHKKFKAQVNALKDIEVNFEKYSYSKEMLDFNKKGDLEKVTNISTGEVRYKTLKPRYDFTNEFQDEAPEGTFLTIVRILRKKLYKFL